MLSQPPARNTRRDPNPCCWLCQCCAAAAWPDLSGFDPNRTRSAIAGLASTSPSTSQNYTIIFLNVATQGVVLSWLEGNGTLRPVSTLAPGERRRIHTQTGDV